MASTESPFKPAPEKRSPFPDKALPQAGESLRDAAMDLFLDKVFLYVMFAMTFVVVAAVEWTTWLFNQPVSPWLWTGVAAVAGAVAAWRWFRVMPQLAALRQGIRGEREVGRQLEALRRLNYEVFHDIPGDGFNVDHALIGPGGVFAIETKTFSKPGRGCPTVEYDGTRVLVDGHAPDRDPIAQAEAAAAFLRDLLERTTGLEVPVRPVVLFPGWYVTRQPRGCRVWVLNHKALPKFLKHEPARLTRADAALLVDRLTRHLQA